MKDAPPDCIFGTFEYLSSLLFKSRGHWFYHVLHHGQLCLENSTGQEFWNIRSPVIQAFF